MTNSEALSSNHAITEKLRNREYSVMWISTPADWHCKHQKARPKMRNITKWIKLSVSTGLLVMIFGLPGFFWNTPEVKEAIPECKMKEHKIHLCHFELQYDKAPSGSYFKLATNSSGSFPGKCNCSECPKNMQHIVDWFREEEERADWRQRVWHELVGKVINAKIRTTIITDDDFIRVQLLS